MEIDSRRRVAFVRRGGRCTGTLTRMQISSQRRVTVSVRRRPPLARAGLRMSTGRGRNDARIVGRRAEQVELSGVRSVRGVVALLSFRRRLAPRPAVTHACPA
ncbi:hypothetical protein ACVBGC_14375 [Burkholderia stagnalis]